jgi:hypothetical protein
MKSLALAAVLVAQSRLLAGPPPLGKMTQRYFGPHAPLFVVSKSYHPDNVLVVYTTMDDDCRIVADGRGHEIGFYWLDGGKDFHFSSVEGLVRRQLFSSALRVDPHTYILVFNELDRVRHDLFDKRVTVTGRRIGDACEARAEIQLGPSSGSRRLRVTSVYTDLTPSGFNATVHSLSLRGHDSADPNRALMVTYPGAP